MSHTLAVLVAALVSGAPAANPNLERCQKLEAEFDYQGMIAECSIAASDPNTTRDERILVTRLLGFAHTAVGDDDAARVWFLRLLTLDPQHELPKEVSPRFRGAFAGALEEFALNGAVTVDHTPPSSSADDTAGPLVVRFNVKDKLRRVTRAFLEVSAAHEGGTGAPVRSELRRTVGDQEGVVIFEGEVPDPGKNDPNTPPQYELRYRLVLENVIGDEVFPEPALAPVSLARTGGSAVANVGGDGGGGEGSDVFLWAGVAAVGGLVAVGAAAGGVSLALCLTLGCGNTDLPAPTGYVRVELEAPTGATP